MVIIIWNHFCHTKIFNLNQICDLFNKIYDLKFFLHPFFPFTTL